MDFLVTQENWVFSSRIKMQSGMHIACWHFNKMNGLPVVIAGINCLVPVTKSKMSSEMMDMNTHEKPIPESGKSKDR